MCQRRSSLPGRRVTKLGAAWTRRLPCLPCSHHRPCTSQVATRRNRYLAFLTRCGQSCLLSMLIERLVPNWRSYPTISRSRCFPQNGREIQDGTRSSDKRQQRILCNSRVSMGCTIQSYFGKIWAAPALVSMVQTRSIIARISDVVAPLRKPARRIAFASSSALVREFPGSPFGSSTRAVS